MGKISKGPCNVLDTKDKCKICRKPDFSFSLAHVKVQLSKRRFFITYPLEQGLNFALKDTRLAKKVQISNVVSLEMHIFGVFLVFFTSRQL